MNTVRVIWQKDYYNEAGDIEYSLYQAVFYANGERVEGYFYASALGFITLKDEAELLDGSDELKILTAKFEFAEEKAPAADTPCLNTNAVNLRKGPAKSEPKVDKLAEGTHVETVLASASVSVTILPGRLPAQKLIRTHWFHTDCLAEYYRVPVFSEEHWTIIENFIRTAVRRGCTMILTPLFTPPLDTAPGGERLTVQLVDVNVCKGAYTFGFDRLERWVEICRRCGVAYLEMSHLFTQWGAAAAPKIIATVDGQEKRLFGWETDAHGEAYAHFLSEFLPALMEKLNELGVAERAYFHISDEPSLDHLESYRHACSLVKPYLQGRPVIDALSDFAFYQTGALEKPVVALDHLEPFLQAGVPGLWTYYCVGQYRDVTNSFMAMPAARTRMLGVQLYRYQLEGFLQWGYNFYHTQLSLANLNPYEVTDAGGVFPSGDAFQVYPGRGGKPEESIRFMLNHLAMQDLRALEALETLQGREQVLRLLEECAQGPLTLTDYPRDAAFFDRLRQRVNKELSGRL